MLDGIVALLERAEAAERTASRPRQPSSLGTLPPRIRASPEGSSAARRTGRAPDRQEARRRDNLNNHLRYQERQRAAATSTAAGLNA